MPTAYVEQVAEEKGISVSEAEAVWERAKSIASEKYNEDDEGFYAIVTAIFKNMMSIK